MLKKVVLVVSFVLLGASGFAQKQNNQWRFGAGGGVNFNTDPPSFVAGSAIATNEGSASVADKTTGALLFYTDGVTVWNALNQVMPNGTSLDGGSTALSSTTAAVIVPKPSSANLFYIVTVDEQFSPSGVRYSVVDMSLNGGLGDVLPTQKNVFLLNTTSEKLEVVPAADGQSFWLLAHDEPGNTFYAYKITSAGIQNTPVVSTIGSTQSNGAGHMKINKQFTKIAIGVTPGGKMELFDFNNATGVVSNLITWTTNFPLPLVYGIEFSPNGNVLYVSNLERLVQYDLTQATGTAIGNSALQLSSGFYAAASLQLGPDDKIYINSGTVDVINCPNKLGVLCDFQQNAIAGQTGGGGYGLPKWVYYPDDAPLSDSNAIKSTGNCAGVPVLFSLEDVNGIVSVTWDFGDPTSGAANNTSNSLTPQHTYASAGTYNVNVVVNYDCFSINLPATVTIDPPVVPTFNPVPSFCAGSTPPVLPTTSNNGIVGTWSPAVVSNTASATYTFTPDAGQCAAVATLTTSVTSCATNQILYSANCQYEVVTFSLQSTTDVVAVNWNFGDVPSGVNNFAIGLTPLHQFVTAGDYVVTATVTTTSGSYPLSVTIPIQPTTLLTFGFPVQYLTGSTVPALPATSSQGIPGTWSPTIIDAFNSGTYVFTPSVPGCYADNQVFISIVDCLTPTFTPIVKICPNTPPPTLPTTSLNGFTGVWSPAIVSNTASATYTFTPDAGQNACAGASMYIEVASGPPTLVLTSPIATLNQTVCVNEFIQNISIDLGGAAVGADAPNLPPGVFGSISGTELTFSGIVLSGDNSPYNFTINTTGGNCGNASISGTITVIPLTEPGFSIPTAICAGQPAPILPTTSNNGITGTWSPAVISNTTDGTYTFTPNAGQCAAVKVIAITVNSTLGAPNFAPIPTLCAGAAPPVLPTTSLNGITGTWSPSTIDTTTGGTYTFTPDAGQCALPTPVPLSVSVTPLVTPTFDPIASFCAGTTAPALPTTSLNGITGTWSPAVIDNAASGTYTFTPEAGQCTTSTPVQVIVTITPITTPLFAPVAPFCAGTTPPVLPTTSQNGITGTWSPATVSNTVGGSYTFTPDAAAGPCVSPAVIQVSVTTPITPTFTPIAPLCSGTTAPVLPTTSLNGITGTWTPSTVNTTNSGTYTFTPTAGQCVSTTPVQISVVVTPLTTAAFDPIGPICAGSTAPVLPTTSLNGITGTWSPSVIDNAVGRAYTFTPDAGQCTTPTPIPIFVTVSPLITPTFNPIASFCSGTTAPLLPTTSLNGITGTWSPATVDNTATATYTFTPTTVAGQCAATSTINVTVLPRAEPDFEDLSFCENQGGYMLRNQSPNGIVGTWSPTVINFVTGGNYTFTPSAGQCASPQTISVTINSSSLTDFTWEVSEPFADKPTITVTPNTPGNYLYQLDGGSPQTSNVFENVSSGFHTVQVRDANGCSDVLIKDDILVITYPKFFTPNGDGYNDTWNIRDLFLQRNSKIYIFDRYGKLLKQIFPFQSGWDGRYNNNDMFSDDYWFVVEYEYNNTMRQFRSHFALKR